MDIDRIRRDFPILQRRVHGKPLVYLDSAATSQKPSVVLAAEQDYYERLNANVHRGVYALSEEATEAFEAARARMAEFVGASDPSEIIFVRGATEGLNLVASCLGRSLLGRGDRVLTTVMEHHSNIVPWQMLKAERGIQLSFVDIDDEGRLRTEEYDAPARVVALTHVSNVLGTVNPVREIAERAHDRGALVVLDAAQSAPHRRLDVKALDVDFLTFSGHKVLGPTGIGVLWGRRELLERLPPWMGGGEMIHEVHTDRVTYREPPARFEAGTPNMAGAIGLHAAVDYLTGLGWDEIAAHERRLQQFALEHARSEFGERLHIVGPSDPREREAVVSFSLQGTHPHDIASLLDAEGVAIRSGHHCAQPLMERLGVSALSRASPYIYNDVNELATMFAGLRRVEQVFGSGGARSTGRATL
jgi:cysteine desulfurase/selenocysteine lyase